MTLFEAKPYDPAPERKKLRLILAIAGGIIVIGILWWMFRFWPEEHVVDQFFDALQQQNYEKAYGVWMHDPDWKQHPEKYARYKYNEFVQDWGPGSEWGVIKSHRIYGTGVPKGHSGSPFATASGVVVVVTVNDRISDKARIWVQNDDKTLGFSPY